MGLKEIVYQKLDDMKIKYDVINHKAIFSESDTDEDLFDKDILIGKNLFLKNDKKSKYYLVCLPLNKRADLKKIAEIIGEKRLSFANEKELSEYLNISPGSVSYLNVITAAIRSEKYKEVEKQKLELESKNLSQSCARFKELVSQFNSGFNKLPDND